MKHEVKIGQTDYSVLIFIPDPSSADGSGKTGLTDADLTVTFTRVETDNDVVITDATSSLTDLTNLTDPHTDWGLKEVSSALAPGLYRLDIADAVFASGAWSAVVYVMITSSEAAASPMEFVLVPDSPVEGVKVKSITAGAVDASAVADGAIDAGALATSAINKIQAGLIVASGIIGDTGNDTTHLHLEGQTFGDDEINDMLIVVLDVSENEYHSRWVADWANTGDLATVATLPFTPQNDTDQYWLLPVRRDVTATLGTGAITSSTFAAGAINAAAIAADAIGASELAADAASEIATAVWAAVTRTLTAATNITSTGGTTVPQTGDAYAIVNSGTFGNSALKTILDTIAGYLDTEIAAILAAVDTEVAAIKAKTDNLPSDPADESLLEAAITAAQTAILGKLLKYVQLICRKDAAIGTDNATEKNAINADGGSGAGSYNQQTDALEGLQAEHDSTQSAITTLSGAVNTPRVNCAVHTKTTEGTPLQVIAWLEVNGAVVNLSASSPASECTAAVILFGQDSGTPNVEIETGVDPGDFALNADDRFEAEVDDPNLSADNIHRIEVSITNNGTTYTESFPFPIFP